MAYEFDEIKFLRDEGLDWWTTIKKVPIKLLDQDFATEVPISDLTDAIAFEYPEGATCPSSFGEDKQDSSEPVKKLSLDCFKRKPDAVKKNGFSKVTFTDKYFEAEVSSNQFSNRAFKGKVEKGFVVISAEGQTTDGDVTVWRKFERRYMLPHDCYVSDAEQQLKAFCLEGGFKVRVDKHDPDAPKKLHKKHPALKAPGRSPSPLKSPPKDNQSSPPGLQRTPPRDKQGSQSQKTPPKEKQGVSKK